MLNIKSFGVVDNFLNFVFGIDTLDFHALISCTIHALSRALVGLW